MSTFPNIYKNIDEIHLEVTNCCNLACRYCYVNTRNKQKIENADYMDIQIANDIIKQVAENTVSPTIKIVFHGGEPLLLKSRWYGNIFPQLKKICSTFGKKAVLCMQTNLTLLDNAMLNLIKEHNIIISTSIDGPEEVHDSYKGLFKSTAENISKIKGIGLSVGVIVGFSFHNYDKVYEIITLFRDLEIKNFLANVVYSMGKWKNLPCLDSEKRFKVHKDLTDYIIKTRGKEIIEQHTVLRINRFFNPPQKDEWLRNLSCHTPFCHAGIRMLMFKPNGDIYPCGFSGGLGTNGYFKLGNIYHLDERQFKEKILDFHKKGKKYYTECQSCEAKIICFFGCPAAEYEDKIFRTEDCNTTKRLFKYFVLRKNELKDLFKMQEVNQ